MKRLTPLLLVLALLLPLVSCREEARIEIENELAEARAANEEKIKEAEKTDGPSPQPAEVEAPTADAADSSASGSPQTEQSSPENAQTGDTAPAGTEAGNTPDYKNDWDGITSSQYTVSGNRYYYYVQAQKTLPVKGGGYVVGGVLAYVYTDLTQGGMQYVCPDPLCSHSDPDVCPFAEVGQSGSFCPAGSAFYMSYFGSGFNAEGAGVVKADLNSNTMKTVYRGRSPSCTFFGSENGVLYIRDWEDKIDSTTKKSVETVWMVALSTETDEVLFERKVPEDIWIISIRDGKIICSSQRELLECDMNFENRKTLFSFEGTGGFGEWYYDENRGEFWFNLRDRDEERGEVWRILPDGTAEKVPLPGGEIWCFQLTNSKIYYCLYDPVWLSDVRDWRQGPVDWCAGRIRAVDRDDPGGEPVLVYDAAGKYYFGDPGISDALIFGDQLFFPKVELVRYYLYGLGEQISFSIAGDCPMVHVNLATGEEEIFRFD